MQVKSVSIFRLLRLAALTYTLFISISSHALGVWAQDRAVAESLFWKSNVTDGIYVDRNTPFNGSSEPKWLSAIVSLRGTGGSCSGALIAPQVVLTAGHCEGMTQASFLIPDSSFTPPGLGNYLQPRVAERRTVIRSATDPFFFQQEAPNGDLLRMVGDRQLLLLDRPATAAPISIFKGWTSEVQHTIDENGVAIGGWGRYSYSWAGGDQLIASNGGVYQSYFTTSAVLKTSLQQDRWQVSISGSSGAVPLPGDSGSPIVTTYNTGEVDFRGNDILVPVVAGSLSFGNSVDRLYARQGFSASYEPFVYGLFLQDTLENWSRLAGVVTPSALTVNAVGPAFIPSTCQPGYLCAPGGGDYPISRGIDNNSYLSPVPAPISSVPEPNAFTLFAAGVIMSLTLVRRRIPYIGLNDELNSAGGVC